MRRILLFLPLLLAACGFTAPPRDNAQWTTEVRGVTITWRLVNPGSLGSTEAGQYVGFAQVMLLGETCVVDIDATLARYALARVAAHEAGHCFAARYLLLGPKRPDIGPYYDSLTEGYAETYAEAYLRACGDSLRPLGWADFAVPTCAEAPDPRLLETP